MSAENIMHAVGRTAQHPEGRFFPDTYVYPKGSSDMVVWRQAATAMDRKLAEAWAGRDAGLPLKSADEALALASIIEKEILEAFNPRDIEQIHAVFVGGATTPARVRVFVDFLAECLR